MKLISINSIEIKPLPKSFCLNGDVELITKESDRNLHIHSMGLKDQNFRPMRLDLDDEMTIKYKISTIHQDPDLMGEKKIDLQEDLEEGKYKMIVDFKFYISYSNDEKKNMCPNFKIDPVVKLEKLD